MSELDSSTKLKLYREMVRIRVFENAVRRLLKEGEVPARFGFYTGQEAIAVGVSAHLRDSDRMGSTHRPLGHLIATGCNLNKLMAELCAKRTGFNKGKAGPYHVFDPSVGAVGANGIVGGSVPMASGYALAYQYLNNKGVTVSYFGEGASNQGGVQESLNLATCWNLPVVFVCENSSPEVQRMLGHEIDYPQLSIRDISERASAYGMPGSTHDGWDVIEVYHAAEKALKRARDGCGPTLLEFKVHQLEGNLEGRIEVEGDSSFCPIQLFKERLEREGFLYPDLDEQIKDEERDRVQAAVDYALKSPEPELIDAHKGVFTEED